MTRLHHVGIAVESLDDGIARWSELLGATLERRETLIEQGVEAAALRVGDSLVELLAPLGPDTPVARFLERRSPGLHHVAFAVSDVAAELDRLRAAGTRLVDEEPRRGLYGLEVAFVHPEATGGVLAEFVGDEHS